MNALVDPITTHEIVLAVGVIVSAVCVIAGILILWPTSDGRPNSLLSGGAVLGLPVVGLALIVAAHNRRPTPPLVMDFTHDHAAAQLFDASATGDDLIWNDVDHLRIELPKGRYIEGAFDEVIAHRSGNRITSLQLHSAYYLRAHAANRVHEVYDTLRMPDSLIDPAASYNGRLRTTTGDNFLVPAGGPCVQVDVQTPRRDFVDVAMNW